MALPMATDRFRFKLAVLLPGMQSADLIELLKKYLLGYVVESGPAQFTDATGLGRCP